MAAKVMAALLIGSVVSSVAVMVWTVMAHTWQERVFRVGRFAFRILMDWPLIERVER